MPELMPLDASSPLSRYTRNVTQQNRPNSRLGVYLSWNTLGEVTEVMVSVVPAPMLYHFGNDFPGSCFRARALENSPLLNKGDALVDKLESPIILL